MDILTHMKRRISRLLLCCSSLHIISTLAPQNPHASIGGTTVTGGCSAQTIAHFVRAMVFYPRYVSTNAHNIFDWYHFQILLRSKEGHSTHVQYTCAHYELLCNPVTLIFPYARTHTQITHNTHIHETCTRRTHQPTRSQSATETWRPQGVHRICGTSCNATSRRSLSFLSLFTLFFLSINSLFSLFSPSLSALLFAFFWALSHYSSLWISIVLFLRTITCSVSLPFPHLNFLFFLPRTAKHLSYAGEYQMALEAALQAIDLHPLDPTGYR